ncbi:MAG: ErpK protein [Lachnospiraceae bacterium]|nr:ErpK protein [Lachnospiraceae bacterium]
MARTRRTISIDEKIEQQKQVVSQAKDKYEAALAELDRLQQKKDEVRNKELIEAISNSSRSYEDIMAFLKDGGSQD